VTDDRQTDHATEKWVAVGRGFRGHMVSPSDGSKQPWFEAIITLQVSNTKYITN